MFTGLDPVIREVLWSSFLSGGKVFGSANTDWNSFNNVVTSAFTVDQQNQI
jgi:hypothetical protein